MNDIPEYFFEEVDTTMEEARTIASRAFGDAFLVRTHHQRAGRGRRGRSWFDIPGGAIMVTLAVRRRGSLDPGDDNPGILALRTGAAVAETVESIITPSDTRGTVAIKWPNDVYIDDGKVAGILIEADPRWFYIGIGLNTYRPDETARVHRWRDELTAVVPRSLREYGEIPREEMIVHTLGAAFSRYFTGGEWLEAVRRRLAWKNSHVGVTASMEGGTTDIRGTLLDIADTGALILETPTGRVTVFTGTVRRLPAP